MFCCSSPRDQIYLGYRKALPGEGEVHARARGFLPGWFPSPSSHSSWSRDLSYSSTACTLLLTTCFSIASFQNVKPTIKGSPHLYSTTFVERMSWWSVDSYVTGKTGKYGNAANWRDQWSYMTLTEKLLTALLEKNTKKQQKHFCNTEAHIHPQSPDNGV